MSAWRAWLALCLMLVPGCAAISASAPIEAELAAIEARSGGRLGLALVDSSGRLIAAHRADERFAMCSTFKLPLAAMVLDRVAAGQMDMAMVLPVTDADMVVYSPYVEAQRAKIPSETVTVEGAASAAVSLSDNTAANLLLDRLGGPQGLTAWLRTKGDLVTRLDRREPDLNENAPGDPRDTSSPAAMARTTRQLVAGKGLGAPQQAILWGWMQATATGLGRIRAGLPSDWVAGDKTGTCGTAYNDVAHFRSAAGNSYVLAIYLDRPSVKGDAANAVIADSARAVARLAE